MTHKMFLVILMMAASCILSTPAYALSCGDTVSGNVTLTADLACTDSNGLIVGANGTTINLNGFTISCTGLAGGFLGSCQPTQTGPTSRVGIQSINHSNVLILGPGKVTGFGVGVDISGGDGLRVIGVTITGPAPNSDFTADKRLLTVGVVVNASHCVFAALAPAPSFTVAFNDISQQTQGVQLSAAQCGVVAGNVIYDNAGKYDSHGIDIINSSANTIEGNQVLRTGVAAAHTGDGISMFNGAGGNTGFNNVVLNYIDDNCADGVDVFLGAHNNAIASNVILNNGIRCSVGGYTFYDVEAPTAGPGNNWINDTCHSQGSGVPANTCHN
jgi:hypothetical protein